MPLEVREMANMKNAKKKIKTIAKEKELNNVYRSSMRTAMRNVEKAVASNDKEKAKDALATAIKRIDKAGSKGIVHKNFVARNKSRLTKKLMKWSNFTSFFFTFTL